MIEHGTASESSSNSRPAPVAAWPPLSRGFKDSFKLALSVVIAMGIALSMDWDRPYWSALAIMFCSFTATGDSLNKGLLRMAGTGVAVVITFALIGLVPQSRWLFILLVSVWATLCAYLVSGGSKGYLWQCAGIAVPMLAVIGGIDPVSSFDTVIMRAQETGLGFLVYSVVSVLLWPSSSREPFENAVAGVADAERQGANYLFRIMSGGEEDSTADAIRAKSAPLIARLPTMLDGAELDDADIRARRFVWRRIVTLLGEIREAMERWHSSLRDAGKLDLEAVLPGRHALAAEIDRRLGEVRGMLQGKAPDSEPVAVDLGLDPGHLAALPVFARAALISCKDQMGRLDRLTAALHTHVAVARGFAGAADLAVSGKAGTSAPVHDADRFLYAFRVFIAVWLAALIAFYVPGLPGDMLLVTFSASLTIALPAMPQVSILMTQRPVLHGVLFAGLLYLLVMPRLSSSTELGIVLFLAVFGIAYRFPAEKAPLDRAIWLVMVAVLTGVSNSQSYSFMHLVNIATPLVLAIWLIALVGLMPISFQPQDRFLAQVRRFFRSSGYLVSDAQWRGVPAASPAERYRERFHAHEVSSIPTKMLAFCPGVKARIGAGAQPSPEALVGTLQGLRRRIIEVHAARTDIAAFTRQLPEELRAELVSWRTTLDGLFGRLSEDPEALVGASLAARLEARVGRLETVLKTTLKNPGASPLTDADILRLYRLLAALRDVSSSLADFEQQAATFPWSRLRESRF